MRSVQLMGHEVAVHVLHTAVVGSGAAGLNAADQLVHYGIKDIAIVTDALGGGTSRNTGSDKQTYYKLTLSGGQPDSVRRMAETLFSGQCVDGDHALCEAALSAKSFLRLCELGVPFPMNRYGEYVGYKTDHDPAERATSAGPLTSKLMAEALERSVVERGIRVLDGHQVVSILADGGTLMGLLCLDHAHEFALILCRNVIYATGGPAGIYQDSCYPLGHMGQSGIAFEAGAVGKNLTEWQYGLASVNPRWNVSGTYMQCLPRFVSVDKDGVEREFLKDYIDDAGQLLTRIFLKGYQWPFDVRKIDGSSLIDLCVYTESQVHGRKIYLDFRRNPLGDSFDFAKLDPEARNYLGKADALFGTPIERLSHMNEPAVAFYRSKGVDLAQEMLEIALCSQHMNGGISVDSWWQTDVRGLFCAGEAAATHGVYRPGGSALNAGQVGSDRAARFIAATDSGGTIDIDAALDAVRDDAIRAMRVALDAKIGTSNLAPLMAESTRGMSQSGAAVRNAEAVSALLDETQVRLCTFTERITISGPAQWSMLYRYRDMLISQCMVLSAMLDYLAQGGGSRGAALYTDAAGEKPLPALPDSCRYLPDDGTHSAMVQEVAYRTDGIKCTWRPVRTIPCDDDFFENVWRDYRMHGNVF